MSRRYWLNTRRSVLITTPGGRRFLPGLVPSNSTRSIAEQNDGGYTLQWIGLRENLQETIDFPIKYGAFL